jgi:hypothetical protein
MDVTLGSPERGWSKHARTKRSPRGVTRTLQTPFQSRWLPCHVAGACFSRFSARRASRLALALRLNSADSPAGDAHGQERNNTKRFMHVDAKTAGKRESSTRRRVVFIIQVVKVNGLEGLSGLRDTQQYMQAFHSFCKQFPPQRQQPTFSCSSTPLIASSNVGLISSWL